MKKYNFFRKSISQYFSQKKDEEVLDFKEVELFEFENVNKIKNLNSLINLELFRVKNQ